MNAQPASRREVTDLLVTGRPVQTTALVSAVAVHRDTVARASRAAKTYLRSEPQAGRVA